MLKAYAKSPIGKEKIYVSLMTGVQFFNLLDFVIILPMGPMLMRYFQISPVQFATLASSYNISSGIVSLLYSSFADKFERKKLLLIVLFLFILSTLLCALAPNYYFFLGARIIAGVFGGILTPSIYAIISDLIPFERRGKALGTIMASFSITSVFGIPLGLAIADNYSWRHAFYFIGAGASIVFLGVLFVLPKINLPQNHLSLTNLIKRVIRISLTKKYFPAFASMVSFTFSGFLLFPFFSPYAVKNIGITESELKYIYLAGGAVTIFVSKAAGYYTDKIGPVKTFTLPFIFSLYFTYLYTTAQRMDLFVLLLISTGFMVMINARFVPIMKLITGMPSEADRGSFMGFLMAVRSLSAATATIIAGFIIIETPTELKNFDLTGYFSIFVSLVGSILFIKLNQYFIGQNNASRN